MTNKTVLLAWELGGGMGHVTALYRLARRLKYPDVRLVAALKDPAAGGTLAAMGVEIVQAPLWPSVSMTHAHIARSSSTTMGDILATAGLADPAGLKRLLQDWDDHFIRIKPDLVVADMAPAAALVARGQLPLIIVGNGFTLPPSEMLRFPPLHRLTPPAFDEDETLSIVNSVLKSRGQARLDWLPQMFSGDARLVLAFPLLDPYRTQRAQPADGPVLDQVPHPSDPDAGSIFAYFSRSYLLHPDIPRVLLAHAPKLRIHAPELTDAQADALRRAGASVEADPVMSANAMASARLAIHFGGSGLASEALAAGVPQLVLSMQVEQDLTGGALQGAGVGRLVRAYDPASKIPAGTVDELLQDTGMAERAAEAGRQHREWLGGRDVLASFESKSRELLGG
jgi:UDP:flavonoid glycosyltransferase YjiC (YdhE family)